MKKQSIIYTIALLLGLAALAGCQKDPVQEIPDGMAAVAVTGVNAGAFTRAELTEIDDIASFELTFVKGAGAKTVTVTPNAGSWTLSEPVYLDVNKPGKITAAYTSAGNFGFRDDLTAETGDGISIAYNPATRQMELSIDFRHVNALLDITVKDTDGNDLKDKIVIIEILVEDVDTRMSVASGFQSIVPDISTLNNITVFFSLLEKIVVIDPAETLLEGNKRYPVTITLDADGLRPTLVVGAGIENWGEPTPVYEWRPAPDGYDLAIWSGADLAAFRDAVNSGKKVGDPEVDATTAKVIQLCDIDLSDYQSGEGWVPIGLEIREFKGAYNGNGFRITGLTINRSAAFQGLFGITVGVKLTGIQLVNCAVTGQAYTGALVGWAQNGTGISLCSASGTVKGTQHVGGLVGYNAGTLTRSRSAVDVAGDANVGGVAGYNAGGTIVACEAAGSTPDPSGSTYTGRFAGSNSGWIWFSSSTPTGGFAGSNSGNIRSSYGGGNPATNPGGGTISTTATVTATAIPTAVLGTKGYENMTIENRYFIASYVWKSTPGGEIDYGYEGVAP